MMRIFEVVSHKFNVARIEDSRIQNLTGLYSSQRHYTSGTAANKLLYERYYKNNLQHILNYELSEF
jgi:hypothetical protein